MRNHPLLSALVFLAACGSDEPAEAPAAPIAESPPETTQVAPAEPAPPSEPARIAAPTQGPDPRAAAIAILNACRGSDPNALRALATAGNADDIPTPEANQSLCAAIFDVDSWRNQAVVQEPEGGGVLRGSRS